MDTVNKQTRSEIMSRVRSKETKLEQIFSRRLWNSGIRYRKNIASYFGKPDLVIKKSKLVIFIDSCFWHGCKEHLRMPHSNVDYWTKKIKRNQERDIEVNQYYKMQGWTTVRIWEHLLKSEEQINRQVDYVRSLNT